ncbi:MAG: amidoligase family protein [Armatimonadota bacterium]
MVDLTEIRFGVELETVKQTRSAVAQAIQSVVGGSVEHVGTPSCYDPYKVTDRNNRTWTVVADSSLSSVPVSLRAEIVSPVLGYIDIPEFQEVVRAVRRCGATTSEQTGIHVHISHPDITPKALANLAKMIYKQQDIIYAALGVNKNRIDKYCKPIDPAFIDKITKNPPHTFKQLNTQWYGHYIEHPQRYHTSRYSILNLNGFFLRNAIELRAYAGSLHAGKVRSALIFSMALLARAMNANGTSAKKRKYEPESGKYDMRVFLISALKLNGEPYKNVRKHLLSNLNGDSAWKHGRPIPKVKKPATDTLEVCCGTN